MTVSGLPAGIVLLPSLTPIAPVELNVGNQPAIQVINVDLYVLPGVKPGGYNFSIVGTPTKGADSAQALTLPATLVVTSGAQATWRN